MDTTKIRTERVYDDPGGTTGGFRVFVDRLWPRGESKARFHYDLWTKDVTPSTALRQWFHADRESRWQEFQAKYLDELKANPAMPSLIDELMPHRGDIVLLTAARDTAHNHVPVLAAYLTRHLSKSC